MTCSFCIYLFIGGCTDQRTICKNLFSPTLSDPGIELGSSDLAASTFTHLAISLALCPALRTASLSSWGLRCPHQSQQQITILNFTCTFNNLSRVCTCPFSLYIWRKGKSQDSAALSQRGRLNHNVTNSSDLGKEIEWVVR